MNKNTSAHSRGFTLIELIVAVSIFVIVMLIVVTAVLSAVDTNRRVQNVSLVVNNLNLAVETMVRDLRTGREYEPCGSGRTDCIQFVDTDGNDVVYLKEEDGSDHYIAKQSLDDPFTAGRLTGAEVYIEDLVFTVEGNDDDGGDGPERVLLRLKGRAGPSNNQGIFNIQTVITSRTLDLAELQ